MHIQINIKSIARTRNPQARTYSIKDGIKTAKDLIINLVHIEINRYEQEEIKPKSQEELEQMMEHGKVSFGFRYREHEKIDRKHAEQVALDAFSDGLFVLFLNRREIKSLEEELEIQENDVLDLVRLTMLSGRYY